MVNCAEAKTHQSKVWLTSSEPWDCCGQLVVKLEGWSGGFSVDCLEIVKEPINLDSTEKKYQHALKVLRAIANRSSEDKNGCFNEWTEAEAFRNCRTAAARCLKYLGESTEMKGESDDGTGA